MEQIETHHIKHPVIVQKTKDEITPEMALLIDMRVSDFMAKKYPGLHAGVTIYDFMNSTEMMIYRALLVAVPFSFVIDFNWGPINIAIMIVLFLLSWLLFNLIKHEKSSVLLYWLTGKSTMMWKIWFVVMSAVTFYVVWVVAWWYQVSYEAIAAFFDMIWANIQTLQKITETTGAIKDSVVEWAQSFGTSVKNTATSAYYAVSGMWKWSN